MCTHIESRRKWARSPETITETHTGNRRSTHTGRSTDGKRGSYTYWSKDERKEARTQSFPFRLFYSLYGLSFVSLPLLFLLYSSFPLSTSGSVSPSISLHLHSYPALRSSGSLLTLLCSFSSASSPFSPPFPPSLSFPSHTATKQKSKNWCYFMYFYEYRYTSGRAVSMQIYCVELRN